MIKKIVTALSLLISLASVAQDLPVTTFRGNDTMKPIIFYISGDGGWNNFSTSFMQKLNKQGYPVIGLNAKTYFWNKKKPQQAADDINKLLTQYTRDWNQRSVVLIGYSFGADVMPFIQTRLAKNMQDYIKHTVLMSPSKNTDFEIHVLGMMGFGGSSGESVPAEISKIGKPILLMFGSDENDFPVKDITTGKIQTIKLAGGHHYDGNIDEVTTQIVSHIK